MIARPRKRPRAKSVNFRTFGWLVVHEAALNVCRSTMPSLSVDHFRAWLATSTTEHTRRFGERLIRRDSGRRWWP